MVAGGGASVIYADTVGDLGYTSKLGNYAEYGGAPNEEEVLQYARVVIDVVFGCDMAGIVIGKGDTVTKFNVGDKVYGNVQDFNAKRKLKQLGTLAEFIVVKENLVALKPANLSFDEAASLPLALQIAIEGFETTCFKKGQTIFIVGGAGGVGTLVVQLAKYLFGASNVVSTTSTPKVEFVKSLGVDKVVDYTKTKYEKIQEIQ